MYTDSATKFKTIRDLLSSDQSRYSVMPELLDFAIKLTEKYGTPIGSGLTRVVWNTGKGHVIKVPRDDKGCNDNTWEASTSIVQNKKSDEGYTHCRFFLVNDYCVAIAEFVQEASYDDIKEAFNFIPEWIYYIDCAQVGFDKKGFLKAFDYG